MPTNSQCPRLSLQMEGSLNDNISKPGLHSHYENHKHAEITRHYLCYDCNSCIFLPSSWVCILEMENLTKSIIRKSNKMRARGTSSFLLLLGIVYNYSIRLASIKSYTQHYSLPERMEIRERKRKRKKGCTLKKNRHRTNTSSRQSSLESCHQNPLAFDHLQQQYYPY